LISACNSIGPAEFDSASGAAADMVEKI